MIMVAMESFQNKTPERLDVQLKSAETLTGSEIKPESIRATLLSLDLDSLKTRYPQEYGSYLSILRVQSQLRHFPDMPPEALEDSTKITLLSTGARSHAFKVALSNESRVVKPLESSAEKDIAGTAAALGIGPKQFKTEEGLLHEEFIDGTPILKLTPEQCTPEFMEDLGQKYARALNKLHENNILVNDQILTDDFGKSHMIIDKNVEARFIDFGAAIDLSDFPNIPDEAVLSLMRTDPFMAFRMHDISNISPEEQKAEIEGYRTNILSKFMTKQDIIQWKDNQLLNEGLFFLSQRLPNVQSFLAGVKKEYK